MKKIWFFVGVLVGTMLALATAGDLPDPVMTPGAVNPAVMQGNIQQTVCVAGWTKTIRPPVSYTNKLKKQQLDAYSFEDKYPSHYEEDHLISLEIGGHPTDPKNLWPQTYQTEWNARKKDQLEDFLKREVCAGRMLLADVQQAVAVDWIASYKKYMVRK